MSHRSWAEAPQGVRALLEWSMSTVRWHRSSAAVITYGNFVAGVRVPQTRTAVALRMQPLHMPGHSDMGRCHFAISTPSTHAWQRSEPSIKTRAPLAQWLEQWSYEPYVVGSSPTGSMRAARVVHEHCEMASQWCCGDNIWQCRRRRARATN